MATNPFTWQDVSIKDPYSLIPTYGYWCGPGWSNGERLQEGAQVNPEGEVAVNDFGLTSQPDSACRVHDLAYTAAKGQPDEMWQALKADLQLLSDISKMDVSLMDTKEIIYTQAMAAAFALKLTAYDIPMAWGEAVVNVKEQAKEYFSSILSIFPTSEYGETYTDQFGDSFSFQIDEGGNYILSCDNSAYGEDVAISWTLDASWSSVKATVTKGFDWLFDQIDKFNLLRSIFTTASSTAQRRDPIFTDLNGDGVKTIGVDAGAYFDHDANGFAEQTGWVSPDDGLLVRDINNDGIINNGRELFGDNTLLRDGSLATDGLQALADLDDNGDNKIDSNDAAFSQLKVWKDANSDGISTADELKTLDDLNIKSLNTTYTVTNITDSTGNTQTHQATYACKKAFGEELLTERLLLANV